MTLISAATPDDALSVQVALIESRTVAPGAIRRKESRVTLALLVADALAMSTAVAHIRAVSNGRAIQAHEARRADAVVVRSTGALTVAGVERGAICRTIADRAAEAFSAFAKASNIGSVGAAARGGSGNGAILVSLRGVLIASVAGTDGVVALSSTTAIVGTRSAHMLGHCEVSTANSVVEDALGEALHVSRDTISNTERLAGETVLIGNSRAAAHDGVINALIIRGRRVGVKGLTESNNVRGRRFREEPIHFDGLGFALLFEELTGVSLEKSAWICTVKVLVVNRAEKRVLRRYGPGVPEECSDVRLPNLALGEPLDAVDWSGELVVIVAGTEAIEISTEPDHLVLEERTGNTDIQVEPHVVAGRAWIDLDRGTVGEHHGELVTVGDDAERPHTPVDLDREVRGGVLDVVDGEIDSVSGVVGARARVRVATKCDVAEGARLDRDLADHGEVAEAVLEEKVAVLDDEAADVVGRKEERKRASTIKVVVAPIERLVVGVSRRAAAEILFLAAPAVKPVVAEALQGKTVVKRPCVSHLAPSARVTVVKSAAVGLAAVGAGSTGRAHADLADNGVADRSSLALGMGRRKSTSRLRPVPRVAVSVSRTEAAVRAKGVEDRLRISVELKGRGDLFLCDGTDLRPAVVVGCHGPASVVEVVGTFGAHWAEGWHRRAETVSRNALVRTSAPSAFCVPSA